uniref:Putative ribonuclease H-like domain-containing protein n=1 Tax=Tanacetum cinerariifolium TaxID=118510 RepID=A0A6L2J3C3_TANCI|nr:putative ribonuclease H-like domain-containing protein [Tanacetum cinerariifolium]
MHKAFPVSVREFPLVEKVPTASEESCHCLKKREATTRKIALLSKSRRNHLQRLNFAESLLFHKVIEIGDSYEVPASTASTTTTDTTSGETGKKSRRTVTLTAEDMQKKKIDVKTRTLYCYLFLMSTNCDSTKKNLLKPQYGNFKPEGSETLEQTFNRLQVIIGQLQFMDVEIKQDDLNQKFLTSLAPKWLMHTIVWRNMSDLNTMSLDDLYNHLKGLINQKLNASTVIRWVILQERARLREAKTDEGETTTDREDHALVTDEVAPIEFALMANTSAERLAQVESRLVEYKEREVKYYEKIKTLEFRTESNNECIEILKKKLKTLKQEKERVDGKLAGLLTASKDLDNLIESQRLDKNKEGLGYNVVPPPPAQIYSSPKKDLSWTGLPKFADDTVTYYSRALPTMESTFGDDQNRNSSVSETVASPITPKPFINVLFTDSECIVLGRDFKLLDDANILLRTPRQHNMYSIDLNNIIPHKDLTCLVTKASADECMKWHRRLGHLNFKTMKKLVRHNLVRGLPTKCFENDHTCTACLKGKQHKASCKSKLLNSVTKPLHTLHMDLFGPTFVSSISHKWYCLVVTDDFSRFTWTFFLKSKDETSGILKKFITKIKNLKDLKVKIIRCDNGGEFKNKEMNDFCSQKGIKREFRNARTPQQNGVAERRNGTLIETARTMLADAKLPVTFWAKAVNTACYVQNRVLVNKSHNKTLYELFNDRSPAIGFLKPFGCTKDVAGQEVKKDVSTLRYIALPNWAHDAFLESSSSKSQDDCNTDVPEISRNTHPTATSTIPLADQVETLIVESPIPTASSPVPTACFTDSQEPSKESNGVEADVSNMETTITASPTPTLRIHRDHLKTQIIGPLDTPIQTIKKFKEVGEQGFIATIHQKTDPALLQFCLFSCFLSQVEPKKISDALQDPSWVEAMQEELLLFKIQKMDVKCAFLYGTIDEEVYVMQPPRFQDLEYPDRVYKVEKAIYLDVRSSNTPMDKENPWRKDGTGKDVDLHLYRSMIGSLMYLTASRPDIMFVVCACARHQVTPKEFLEKSEHNVDFHPMVDFVEASPLRIETTEEGTKILATVDSILRTVTESSLRRNLKLQDEEGISSLPDTKLFKNLTLMGYNISQNQKFTFQKGQFSHLWKYLIHTIMQCLSPKSTGFNEFSSNIATALICLTTNWTYNFSKMIFDGLVKNVNNKGEGSGTPTEPHHTPSPEAQQPPHSTHSSTTLPPVTTNFIPTVTPSDSTPIRQYTQRDRIAQSFSFPPVANEHASPLRDVNQGEACPTDSGFIADQDRATIAKSFTLLYDSSQMVTSLATDEGTQEVEINRLKERVKLLEDREGVAAEGSRDDALIKGRNLDEREAVAERASDDTKEMATILTSMDVATFLSSGATEVPTGSGSIPTAGPPAIEVPTGSDVVPTTRPVFATATVVTPYIRRKGKEVMQVEDSIPIGSKEEAKKFKRKGTRFKQEGAKKLKISEEVPEEVKLPDEVTKKKIKQMMQLVPIKEVYIEAFQVKHPIIDWKHQMHAPVEWKLYDMCGVHQVTLKDKEISMIVEKDYPLRKGLAIVMISYNLQVENYSRMANDLVLKMYKIASTPS